MAVKSAVRRIEGVQRRNEDRRTRLRTVGAGLPVRRITRDFRQITFGDRRPMVAVRWRMQITRPIGRQNDAFVT